MPAAAIVAPFLEERRWFSLLWGLLFVVVAGAETASEVELGVL